MTPRKRNLITFALIVIWIILIVTGTILDEPKTVLNKAINVCMECIAIGQKESRGAG